jgi:hypothetical protein
LCYLRAGNAHGLYILKANNEKCDILKGNSQILKAVHISPGDPTPKAYQHPGLKENIFCAIL